MPDALADLSEAKWDTLKKGAKIPNTPIFKALLGGAASVGSAISDYQKARAARKARNVSRDVTNYIAALGKLDAALAKFATIKEFKTPEAKTLKTAIDGWLMEARAKKAKVEAYYKTNEKDLLAADTAKDAAKRAKLWATIDQLGIG